MSKSENNTHKSKIGGQALIEGVMMRGLEDASMAVRNPDGEIVVETWQIGSIAKPKWYRRLIILRGVINFVESLRLGYKCLMRSATIAGLDDLEEKETAKPKAKSETQTEAGVAVEAQITSEAQTGTEAQIDAEPQTKPDKEEKSGKISGVLMSVVGVAAIILGLGLALVLFKMLPSFATSLLAKLFKADFLNQGILKTVIEGVIKIVIFILYLFLVSRMRDIRRTFEYHGAEHKTIACYEAGEELTVENIQKQSRFHPRCGTSFILIVLIVSMIVFFFLPWSNLYIRWALQLALLPFIVGISYEFIKLAGRYTNIVTRIVSAPGLMLQRLTTREPDASQIEVAIASMLPVIPKNKDEDQW